MKERSKVILPFVTDAYTQDYIQSVAAEMGVTFGEVNNYLIQALVDSPSEIRRDIHRWGDSTIDILCDNSKGNPDDSSNNHVIYTINQLRALMERSITVNRITENRKKTSVELSLAQYTSLTKLAEESGTTKGRANHYILSLYVAIKESCMSEAFSQYLLNKVRVSEIEISQTSGFENRDKRINCEIYRLLSELFGEDIEPNSSKTHKIVNLKYGKLIYPKEWIWINEDEPESYGYAGVVECMNSEKYQIPHFVFGTNDPHVKDYTDTQIRKIYDLCQKQWPSFGDIRKKQVSEPRLGSLEEIQRFMDAPNIGLYQIMCDTDPLFNGVHNQPYGCYIHRYTDADNNK